MLIIEIAVIEAMMIEVLTIFRGVRGIENAS